MATHFKVEVSIFSVFPHWTAQHLRKAGWLLKELSKFSPLLFKRNPNRQANDKHPKIPTCLSYLALGTKKKKKKKITRGGSFVRMVH